MISSKLRKELAELQRRGFERVKINGELHQISDAPASTEKMMRVHGLLRSTITPSTVHTAPVMSSVRPSSSSILRC